jgi:hypothetical protein
MDQNTGKYIILLGPSVVVVGILIYFLHDKLNLIGRLPGDISIEKENFKFHFPISTMILASLIFTLLFNLLKRFL